MRRRQMIAAAGASVASAGCLGIGGSSGDQVVSATVRDNAVFPIDVESGQEIEIDVTIQEGLFVNIILNNRDGGDALIRETVESEEKVFEHTAQETGTYEVLVTVDGQVDVYVTIYG